jgi:hypothetical protein
MVNLPPFPQKKSYTLHCVVHLVFAPCRYSIPVTAWCGWLYRLCLWSKFLLLCVPKIKEEKETPCLCITMCSWLSTKLNSSAVLACLAALCSLPIESSISTLLNWSTLSTSTVAHNSRKVHGVRMHHPLHTLLMNPKAHTQRFFFGRKIVQKRYSLQGPKTYNGENTWNLTVYRWKWG